MKNGYSIIEMEKRFSGQKREIAENFAIKLIIHSKLIFGRADESFYFKISCWIIQDDFKV